MAVGHGSLLVLLPGWELGEGTERRAVAPKRMPRAAVGRGRQRETRAQNPTLQRYGNLDAPAAYWLALPQFGLSTVFVVSFISATLLPLGSEPAVFGLVKLNLIFLACVGVATVGNTLGGCGELVDGPGRPQGRWTAPGSPTKSARTGLVAPLWPPPPAC